VAASATRFSSSSFQAWFSAAMSRRLASTITVYGREGEILATRLSVAFFVMFYNFWSPSTSMLSWRSWGGRPAMGLSLGAWLPNLPPWTCLLGGFFHVSDPSSLLSSDDGGISSDGGWGTVWVSRAQEVASRRGMVFCRGAVRSGELPTPMRGLTQRQLF
jgi:hypothetical protein